LIRCPCASSPRNVICSFLSSDVSRGNTSNISLRTHLYKKMGGLSKGVVTDFDFWTRTARETPFLLEESPLTYVRAHKGQASNYLNRHGEAISQQFAIVEELFGRLKKDFPVSQLRVHATVFYDAPQRWGRRAAPVVQWQSRLFRRAGGRHDRQAHVSSPCDAMGPSSCSPGAVAGERRSSRVGCSSAAACLSGTWASRPSTSVGRCRAD
jgi:hypothetical protein